MHHEALDPQRTRALVLAGRRGGEDPLARATGAAHRALLEIDGTPMLARVTRALADSQAFAQVVVSTDAEELVSSVPALAEGFEAGWLRCTTADEVSPARSVLLALAEFPAEAPVLVTTADHALLSPRILHAFLAGAERSEADLCLGMVGERRLRERFPDVQRTYLPFRGERHSGANLFLLRTPRARAAVDFWRRVEADRKQPWKLARAFGLINLALFVTRRLDVDAALERASRVIGAGIAAVRLDDPEAAVDVDKLADLELVQRILAERPGETK